MTTGQKVRSVLWGAVMFLIFLFLPSGIMLVVQYVCPEYQKQAFDFLNNFSTVLIAALLLLCSAGHLREATGFLPGNAQITNHVMAFLLGIFGNIAVSFVMNFLPVSWLESYGEQSAQVYDPSQSVISILAIVLLAPVGEELIFRGFIYHAFRRALPFWVSAGVSALMFGAAHGHPLWICYAFLMGFLFTVMDARMGTLSISILAHVGFNLMSLPLLVLPEDSWLVTFLYGSAERYLLLGISSILICVMIWYLFFSKRNMVRHG